MGYVFVVDLRKKFEDPELAATLRLSLSSGIGPIRVRQLRNHFGGLAATLAAPLSQLRQVQGIGNKLALLVQSAGQIEIERELDHCLENQIDILTPQCETFPPLLSQIPDPPTMLFVRGGILPRDELSVAVVGTRRPTRYGLKQAERFGYELAKAGFTVVSGLARGVDAAAHKGAIRAGGRTIAFLGGGVSNIYPPEHVQLAEDVTAQGALISESAPLTSPLAGAFPQRNRLITGMSLGVIIIEAAIRSGALISARMAMEQNREVFALPGQIDNPVALGCLRLIGDGATMVTSVDDVIEQIGPLHRPAEVGPGETVRNGAELQLNDRERTVLQAIETAPTMIDQIVAESGIPVHQVLSTVSVLEIKRLVQRINGHTVQRM